MIIKCPYCEYAKPDEPLSIPVLKQAIEAEGIIEDQLLWTRRMIDVHTKQYGFSSYRGVKVHIGRKHKGSHNWPHMDLNKQERQLFDA